MIILFVFLFPIRLNKWLYHNIINRTFPDKVIIIDLKSDIRALSSSISTYEEEEISLILDYININTIIGATKLKI